MNKEPLITGKIQAAMLLSVFGTAWLLWGVAVGFPSNYGLLAFAAAAGGVLIVASRLASRAHRRATAELVQQAYLPSSTRRSFRRINIAQWISITLIGSLLSLAGKQALVVPAIVAIVGIHFLPLSALFRSRAHLLTGVALIAIACASPVLSQYLDHQAGVGIGAGAILLVNATHGLATAVSRK